MIKTAALMVFLAAAAPAWACNPDLYHQLDTHPSGEPDMSLDVEERASTEGGEWRIWKQGTNAVTEAVRIDYGEMGRVETRLVIQTEHAYAITQTTYRYGVPIFVEGSMTVRVETDIYMFCKGDLLLPPAEFGVGPDYVEGAETARSAFLAPEIADWVPISLQRP